MSNCSIEEALIVEIAETCKIIADLFHDLGGPEKGLERIYAEGNELQGKLDEGVPGR